MGRCTSSGQGPRRLQLDIDCSRSNHVRNRGGKCLGREPIVVLLNDQLRTSLW